MQDVRPILDDGADRFVLRNSQGCRLTSADTYGGCPNGLTSHFGGSNFGTTATIRYALID